MSGPRCPICGDLQASATWCDSCRSSYRQGNISHAPVTEIAAWGARRRELGAQKRARFERALSKVVDTMRKERG